MPVIDSHLQAVRRTAPASVEKTQVRGGGERFAPLGGPAPLCAKRAGGSLLLSDSSMAAVGFKKEVNAMVVKDLLDGFISQEGSTLGSDHRIKDLREESRNLSEFI